MEPNISGKMLNEVWRKRIEDSGADFVRFVDISEFPENITDGCQCAVIFGKALSKEYLRAIRDDQKPKTKEIFNTERKMDSLAVKIAAKLEEEGYKSIGKLKVGLMPHKTVALRAGLGFIGKNNLLITPEYGCGAMLGKVLTTAPFATEREPIKMPQCGSCTVCVDSCKPGALLGRTWDMTVTRDEMITRKLCTLCHKCMVLCPYTAEYIK